MRFLKFCPALVLIILAATVVGQIPIIEPESVDFDTVNNRYLVSSIAGGSVIQINADSSRSVFASGFGNCLGNQLVGDTLFVSTTTRIVGLSLTDGSEVWSFSFPGMGSIDGLAADTSGNLYIVGTTAKRLYRVRISDQNYSTFVSSLLTSGPQDITFDPWNNRLLLASYTAGAPILGINLEDSSVHVLAISPAGFFDGVTMDQDRNTYLSGSVTGSVYRYDSLFSDPAELMIDGLLEPAGLDFNQRDSILAIPCFVGDTVVFMNFNQPDLKIQGYQLDDSSGDNDLHADPGETVLLSPRIQNRRSVAQSVSVEISTADPNLNLTGGSLSLPAFGGWSDTASTTSQVTIEIDPSCPDPHIALLELDLNAGTYSRTDTLYLFIGDTKGYEDDMESLPGLWRHSSVTNDVYRDEWHPETFRSNSGSTSWKHGGNASDNYEVNSDGGLVTPPFLLPAGAFLSFWHRLSFEAPDGVRAFDGGLLSISIDGGLWEKIYPTPFYPYATSEDSPNAVGGSVFCYSGTFDWERVVFDLSAYSGVAQVMFRFISDPAANDEGWYIDDIKVGNTPPGVAIAVELGPGFSVEFDEVTEPGQTDLTISPTGPELPEGFQAVPSGMPAYLSLSSTATFSGATICLSYDEEDVNNEAKLSLYQYVDGSWVDITSEIDSTANTVCGTATELSTFILVEDVSSCCQGKVGDANCAGGDVPTVSDIGAIVDFLFITGMPLCCLTEADVNQSGGGSPEPSDITVGDIGIIVDHLFITGTSLLNCQ